MDKATVLLVDDHTAIMEMMARVLEGFIGLEVAGRARSAEEAIALCRRDRPSLAIIDLIPGVDGLDLVPRLLEAQPALRIVLFSAHLRPGIVRRAMILGVQGLVEKSAPLSEFELAVRTVMAGGVHFSRWADADVSRLAEMRAAEARPLVRLTEREKAVLRAAALGEGTKEISCRLGMNPFAVSSCRRRLMEKTRIRGVAQLARYAVRMGLVSERVEGAAEALD
jgi:two-component system invasion response regulator UvrY